jgi:toxin ParE1/3/4
MSSPKRRLIIAAIARKDVRGILLYTLQQWGSTQRTRYKSEIDAAFVLITDHPFIGTSRNELGAEVRVRQIGQHIIYYRVEPAVVRVLRVMHVKMDASVELLAE